MIIDERHLFQWLKTTKTTIYMNYYKFWLGLATKTTDPTILPNLLLKLTILDIFGHMGAALNTVLDYYRILRW